MKLVSLNPPQVQKADGTLETICIFCATPTPTRRERSKEHLLAASWNKRLSSPSEYFEKGEATWYDQDGTAHFLPAEEIKAGAPFRMTLSVVCHTCNNGWMSALENASVPVLWKLAKGETSVIGERDLRTLSQWMAKTIVVLECDSPGGAMALNLDYTRAIMDAAIDDTWPPNIATWVLPVAPNTNVRIHASTASVPLEHPPKVCTGHHFVASVIQIHQIAVLSLHTGDGMAWGAIVDPFLKAFAQAPIETPGTSTLVLNRSLAISDEETSQLPPQLRASIANFISAEVRRPEEPEQHQSPFPGDGKRD